MFLLMWSIRKLWLVSISRNLITIIRLKLCIWVCVLCMWWHSFIKIAITQLYKEGMLTLHLNLNIFETALMWNIRLGVGGNNMKKVMLSGPYESFVQTSSLSIENINSIVFQFRNSIVSWVSLSGTPIMLKAMYLHNYVLLMLISSN